MASANELTNILRNISVPIPSLFNLFLKAVATDRTVTQLVATRIQRKTISTVTKTKSSLSSFSSVWTVPKRGCVRVVVVPLPTNGYKFPEISVVYYVKIENIVLSPVLLVPWLRYPSFTWNKPISIRRFLSYLLLPGMNLLVNRL